MEAPAFVKIHKCSDGRAVDICCSFCKTWSPCKSRSPSNNSVSLLYCQLTPSFTWQTCHSATLFSGSVLYIFGGKQHDPRAPSDASPLNDIWKLDIRMRETGAKGEKTARRSKFLRRQGARSCFLHSSCVHLQQLARYGAQSTRSQAGHHHEGGAIVHVSFEITGACL